MTDDLERRLEDCELALIKTERERDDALRLLQQEREWATQSACRYDEARAEAARLAAALRAITDGLRAPRPEADQIGFAYDEAITALTAAPQATAMVEAIRGTVTALRQVSAWIGATLSGDGMWLEGAPMSVTSALRHAKDVADAALAATEPKEKP